MVKELGAFYVWETGMEIPPEATWVIAAHPDYIAPDPSIKVILDWYGVFTDIGAFRTEADIKTVEDRLMTVPTENFWGTLWITEEIYKEHHLLFEDGVNTTWFGEELLGYDLYQSVVPGATNDEWKDEMFFRMVRGAYNYWKSQGIKVGTTMGGNKAWNEEWTVNTTWGLKARNFIKANFDFIFFYQYTPNLDRFWNHPHGPYSTEDYFESIKEFTKQKKFWILTRIWPGENDTTWEKEVIALELKNAFDQNMVTTVYYWNQPPFSEIFPLVVEAVSLYETDQPYYEEFVEGENRLTEIVGPTYGWVGYTPLPQVTPTNWVIPVVLTGIIGAVILTRRKP